MEDKQIDPRILAARTWREKQDAIKERQNQHMFKVFIISVLASVLIILLSKMIGSVLVRHIIQVLGITILGINGWALRYRQVKRNRIAENIFYQRLDNTPRPQETKPYEEIVEG